MIECTFNIVRSREYSNPSKARTWRPRRVEHVLSACNAYLDPHSVQRQTGTQCPVIGFIVRGNLWQASILGFLRTIFWKYRSTIWWMVPAHESTHPGLARQERKILFGIVGRALCRKNVDEDKFCGSSEFQVVREELNSLQLEKMAGSNYNFPAILPETPPSTPDEIGSNQTNAVSVSLGKPTIEALQDVEKTTGPRLKAKRTGKFAKDCLEVLRENLTSSGEDLGKALGYGMLYSGQDNEEFVRETISSALSTVTEKQGVRKAFSTLLTENIYNEYVNSMRVPDWIQLYVKLSTKLPNRSWQTLLNFLNIGRSGVSLILRSFVSSMFYLT